MVHKLAYSCLRMFVKEIAPLESNVLQQIFHYYDIIITFVAEMVKKLQWHISELVIPQMTMFQKM